MFLNGRQYRTTDAVLLLIGLRKKARLAVKDLYSKWQCGEKKLQLVLRFLAAARLCMDEIFSREMLMIESKNAAAAVQPHTNAKGCSDD